MRDRTAPRATIALMLTAALTLLGAPGAAQEVPETLDLELVAEGFTSPVQLVSPSGDERRFVVDQAGLVHVLEPDDTLLADPFLDVRELMVPLRDGFDERGLLGLAFHPAFGDNGRFFVHYSAPLRDGALAALDHTSTVSEFHVSADDPNRADPDSQRVVLRVDQPQFNHNGGAIAFGPDGYLYIALGDGGGANDTGAFHPPLGNGQDVSTLLGAILRIDVDVDQAADGRAYAIPSDNPFAGGVALGDDHEWSGAQAREEIYLWGLRNPYRFSFDGETGELWVADVGQNLWEEVNLVTEPGNFGWNIKEGTHWFDPDEPNAVLTDGPDAGPRGEALVDPVIEYGNLRQVEDGRGISVIGGYRYRGEAIPELDGAYVFGDWSESFGEGAGTLFVAAPNGDLAWEIVYERTLDHFVLSIGQDAAGELYLLTTDSTGPQGETGRVYRLVAAD